MKYTIFYADCLAKASGDYSAAAEIAYNLQNYYYQHHEDEECILLSSKGGVDKFKSLYGQQNDNVIHVHNVPFEVYEAHEFLNNKKLKQVDKFIEVAMCSPLDNTLLADFVKPLSTKVLFIGLPHYPADSFENNLTTRYPELCKSGRVHALLTGFGADRIGIPFHQSESQALNHEKFYGITRKPYGFAYYKGNEEDKIYTLSDYLLIASSLKDPYKNFVFIGESKTNLRAIKNFVMKTGKTVNVYNNDTNLCHHFTFDVNNTDPNNALKEKEFMLSKDVHLNENEINVALFQRVSSDEMRNLMENSKPFICSEGISTPIEAMALGKILFLQFGSQNKNFYPSYANELKKNVPGKYQIRLNHYLNTFVRDEFALPSWQRNPLINLLNDKEFTSYLSNKNKAIITSLPNTAECIMKEFEKPGKHFKNVNPPQSSFSVLSFIQNFIGNLQNKNYGNLQDSEPTIQSGKNPMRIFVM